MNCEHRTFIVWIYCDMKEGQKDFWEFTNWIVFVDELLVIDSMMSIFFIL